MAEITGATWAALGRVSGILAMLSLLPGLKESITLPSGPRTVVLEMDPSLILVNEKITLALAPVP